MSVIGLDLGGTKLKGAIFTEHAEIVYKGERKLEHRTGEDVGKLIQDFVSDTLKQAEGLGEVIDAVGICVPGISYQDKGTVWCPNIPGWEDYPLKAKIQEVCKKNVIVTVDSDRVCCILGEAWSGAAENVNNAIFLAVGTGIAAGILANGRVLRGAHDISGAIGWWALDKQYKDKYEPCGCFEHHCSGEGLAKVARELLEENKSYDGPLRKKPIEQITSYDLFEGYPQGNEIAEKTFDVGYGRSQPREPFRPLEDNIRRRRIRPCATVPGPHQKSGRKARTADSNTESRNRTFDARRRCGTDGSRLSGAQKYKGIKKNNQLGILRDENLQNYTGIRGGVRGTGILRSGNAFARPDTGTAECSG